MTLSKSTTVFPQGTLIENWTNEMVFWLRSLNTISGGLHADLR